MILDKNCAAGKHSRKRNVPEESGNFHGIFRVELKASVMRRAAGEPALFWQLSGTVVFSQLPRCGGPYTRQVCCRAMNRLSPQNQPTNRQQGQGHELKSSGFRPQVSDDVNPAPYQRKKVSPTQATPVSPPFTVLGPADWRFGAAVFCQTAG